MLTSSPQNSDEVPTIVMRIVTIETEQLYEAGIQELIIDHCSYHCHEIFFQ